MIIASLFEVVIVKPIFNLLVLIYGILPGHNFGLAVIIFTIIVRMLMWPLVKKQLHQARAMRELQPDIKRIKKSTKGDKQKQSLLLMELYKEREISPFGSIGTLIVQLIVLLGLYDALRRVVADPHAIISLSYTWLHSLPWLQTLQSNIHAFDASLFGVVDLTRAAINKGGGIYVPAMIIVLGSAVAQFFQAKQLMPSDKDGRGLRAILKDAGSGKPAESGEVNAAVGQSTKYLMPVMIIFFTINLASALSLYWLASGLVAYLQQARILSQGEKEMETIANKPDSVKKPKKDLRTIIEGEIIEKDESKPKPKPKTSKSKKKSSKSGAKKRRKK
ncbi:MAG: YidC/Oxa1 family membrane protein insertase [Candidatus Saccharimonadales bacterium]